MLVPVVTIVTPLMCGSTLFPGCSTTRVNGVPAGLEGDLHHCWRCGGIGKVLPLGTIYRNPEGREIATFLHIVSCCGHLLLTGDPAHLVDV